MTEQPAPESHPAQSVAPVIIPNWQQIALLILWRLLPPTEKSITLTAKDMDDLMAAYTDGPVLTLRPTGDSMTVGLMTKDEAEAAAVQYNNSLPGAENFAPGSSTQQ